MDDMNTPELIAAAHRVAAQRLSWGTSGNISARADSDSFVISATGVRLGELSDDRVAVCAITDDRWEGAHRPSVETGMHRAVYAVRSDVGAVLHCSPPHATLLACSAAAIDPNVTTDSVYYVGAVGRVGFELPGTPELAAAVAAAIQHVDALLLESHGCLVVGASLEEVVNRAEALEEVCHMLVAEARGFELRRLTPANVERLRTQMHGEIR
jgi:L-fuculose-phosphate aldolase